MTATTGAIPKKEGRRRWGAGQGDKDMEENDDRKQRKKQN